MAKSEDLSRDCQSVGQGTFGLRARALMPVSGIHLNGD